MMNEENTADSAAEVARPAQRSSPPEGSSPSGPEQSGTRALQSDPEWLRKNKILSILHAGTVPNQIKILRTQVLNRLAELGGNSLLIASPGAGEGKTFTAVNLAVSISHEVSRTVLLVDADLGKPDVHRRFGFQAPRGLSDYLLGEARVEDLLVNPGLPKLTILPAGQRLANSSELLGGPRMQSLVSELKARYEDRILIFDTPALLNWADALVFSRHIDAILLVVEAEKTPRKALIRALSLVADRPVLGIVYNKSPELRP